MPARRFSDPRRGNATDKGTGHLFEFTFVQGEGIDSDAAFATTVRNVNGSTFPGHEGRQATNLIQVHTGMEPDAALEGGRERCYAGPGTLSILPKCRHLSPPGPGP